MYWRESEEHKLKTSLATTVCPRLFARAWLALLGENLKEHSILKACKVAKREGDVFKHE